MERIHANRIIWCDFRMSWMVEFEYSFFVCRVFECNINRCLSYYNVNQKFHNDDTDRTFIHCKQPCWKLHWNESSLESKTIWIFNNFIQRIFYKLNVDCFLHIWRQPFQNIFKWWDNYKSYEILFMVFISIYIFQHD